MIYRGSLLLFKSTFVYLCQSLDMNVNYVHIHIVIVFLSSKIYVYFLTLYPQKNVYRGVLEYVVNTHGFLSLMECAPRGKDSTPYIPNSQENILNL